jgi:hypothetical protein
MERYGSEARNGASFRDLKFQRFPQIDFKNFGVKARPAARLNAAVSRAGFGPAVCDVSCPLLSALRT